MQTAAPRPLRILALCGAFALTLAAGCGGPTEPVSVVLITLDTVRADHLGCYGYERARTPNLDAFASRSICFENATTPSNNTLPAHASILTGRYPHTMGVPRNSFPIPEEEVTLAQHFAELGYETAAFVSASVLASSIGLGRGFELYDETFGIQEMDHEQRLAETTVDAVLEWFDKRSTDRPFFLWIHFFDPHYPYTPPPPFDGIYGTDYVGPADGSMEYLCTIWGADTLKIVPSEADIQRLIDLYDGEIAYLDSHLGRLFDYFAQPGLRESAVIALTADHGESLDEHEYYFDHGLHLYEPGIHVPLLLHLPDGFGAEPHRITPQVQVLDLFPTLLATTGAPPSTRSEGKNLLPLIQGDVESVRRYSFSEACRPWRIEQLHPNKYRNLYKAQSVVEGPWKLIVTPFLGTTELYNMDRDPEELMNLAQAEPIKTAELYRQLRTWRKGNLPSGGPPDPENLERLRSLGYTR